MYLGSLPTTDGTATRLALARLEREGHDGPRLLALSGLSATLLRRRQRFGLASQLRFLDLAAVTLNDPCLGVRIARELELRDLGLLYYVVASARTAREGLTLLARYVGISNDSISIAVTEARGSARVSLSFAGTSRPRSDRQFAELVPFPGAILDDDAVVNRLAKLADQITELQGKAVRDAPEGVKAAFRATLESLWGRLDEEVELAYGLNREQKEVLQRYPRRINRVDLLARQSSAPEEE